MRNDAPERSYMVQHRPHNTYHPPKNSEKREMSKFESTLEGDVVVIGTSYDPEVRRVSDPAKGDDNARSGGRPSHRRDLSAHFYDATRLTDDLEGDRAKREYPLQHARPPRDRMQVLAGPRTSPPQFSDGGAAAFSLAANAPPMSPSIHAGNKHRRGPSGGFSNPSVAHRRINSLGDSTQIDRYGYSGGYPYYPPARTGYHRREDSAGLDILSAVADESNEQLEMAAGKRGPGKGHWQAGEPHSAVMERRMDPPRKVTMTSLYDYPPPSSNYAGRYAYNNAPPPSHASMQYYPQDHGYPPQSAPHPRYHHRGPTYPTQYAPLKAPQQYPLSPSYMASSSADKLDNEKKSINESSEWRSNDMATGSQGFQTSIGGNDENRSVVPVPIQRGSGTGPELLDQPPLSQSVGHHRKLSSYSSLGAIFGSSLFSETDQNGQGGSSGNHHRSTSSSVSLLQGLDGDLFFTQPLQASAPQTVFNPAFSNPRPMSLKQTDVVASNEASGHALAVGGTSKRIRRKCTVGDCANRVVQGGLCIAHGAKRKTCQHPGCGKNVKKAGMCSTHGPARKRCENRGCGKVAVQGGRCIAHGAKKKLCECEGCNKQAILSGMCKKHYDASNGSATSALDAESSVLIHVSLEKDSQATESLKPSHARGLSIFQEISAESVHSLLSSDVPAGDVHPLKDN